MSERLLCCLGISGHQQRNAEIEPSSLIDSLGQEAFIKGAGIFVASFHDIVPAHVVFFFFWGHTSPLLSTKSRKWSCTFSPSLVGQIAMISCGLPSSASSRLL